MAYDILPLVTSSPTPGEPGVPVYLIGDMVIGTAVEVSNDVGNPIPVSGTVSVGNFPASFQVSNFPASFEIVNDVGNPIPINGTVSVGNFPSTQTIDGTVAVSNFPATQAVSGPLTDTQLRASAVPVSGPLTDAQLRATPAPVNDDCDSMEAQHATLSPSTDTTVTFAQQVRLVHVVNWDTGARVLVKDGAISSDSDASATRIGKAPAADVPNDSWFPFKTTTIHLRSSAGAEVSVEGYF